MLEFTWKGFAGWTLLWPVIAVAVASQGGPDWAFYVPAVMALLLNALMAIWNWVDGN